MLAALDFEVFSRDSLAQGKKTHRRAHEAYQIHEEGNASKRDIEGNRIANKTEFLTGGVSRTEVDCGEVQIGLRGTYPVVYAIDAMSESFD